MLYGIFRLHTTNIVEMFVSSRWSDDALRDWFEFEGRGELDRALAGGRGVILVSGHFGSWELSALYLQSLGYRLSVVAGIQMNRLLTGAGKDAKERRGITVINPNDSGRSYLKTLQSNGVLVLLVDGNIYTGGVNWPLFGKPTRLPDGPIRLAKAAGAPVLGGYCRRIGDARCAIHVERILDSRELETHGESEALAKTYGAFERFVGENADQWCIFRRIWGD